MFRPGPSHTFQRCKKCGAPLQVQRNCRAVTLRCRSCGTIFDLKEYTKDMDDDFEEAMACVPIDRI